MRAASTTATLSALLAICLSRHAAADLTITGSVTPSWAVPIVQPPLYPTGELLKMKLEVASNAILLCIGTFNDIFSTPPRCGQPLGDPVGPGGRAGPQAVFLVNPIQLSDRYLYVYSYPNTPTTSFTLTIE